MRKLVLVNKSNKNQWMKRERRKRKMHYYSNWLKKIRVDYIFSLNWLITWQLKHWFLSIKHQWVCCWKKWKKREKMVSSTQQSILMYRSSLLMKKKSQNISLVYWMIWLLWCVTLQESSPINRWLDILKTQNWVNCYLIKEKIKIVLLMYKE